MANFHGLTDVDSQLDFQVINELTEKCSNSAGRNVSIERAGLTSAVLKPSKSARKIKRV